jgi:4-hydroxy-3-methylbut-2-enyl diphosphate reductase
MGVRRAVDMAGAELRAAGPGRRVYTMGPLIHNPQLLASLKSRGVDILDEKDLPRDLSDSVVIIRAHGISPVLEAELVSRGVHIADATCPKVKASQNRARSLSQGGYRIFLAGERRHGEIIGIQGFAPACIIVADPGEAAAAAEQLRREGGGEKTALIGQTTISAAEYRAIGEAILPFFPRLEIVNTICTATRDRQDALKQLCNQVDALIVAGGRESANTRRLLGIAQELGKPAWLVESAAGIPPEIAAYTRVGLSAGASTPDEVICGIEAALLAMGT